MTAETVHISDHLQADQALIILLKTKNYKALLNFLDTNCRYTFCTERSGDTFERWIDWCAQNAGNIEDAKQVLLRLFAKFYRRLPPSAQGNLAYLGEEIGYHPSATILCRLQDISTKLLASGLVVLGKATIRFRAYASRLPTSLTIPRKKESTVSPFAPPVENPIKEWRPTLQ